MPLYPSGNIMDPKPESQYPQGDSTLDFLRKLMEVAPPMEEDINPALKQPIGRPIPIPPQLGASHTPFPGDSDTAPSVIPDWNMNQAAYLSGKGPPLMGSHIPANAPEGSIVALDEAGAPPGGERVPVGPVPPPIPTNVPVRELGPSGAIPGGTPAPAFQPPAPPAEGTLDPNELLKQAYYQPAVQLAMEARQRDLDRMRKEGYPQAHNLLGTGILSFNPAIAAQGAEMLNRLKGTPIETETLAKAGVAGQEMAKAQLATQELDPNSPMAKAAQLAFHSSSEFDAASKNMSVASGGKMSEQDARVFLYKQTQGLTPVGIRAFSSVMKSSGDYSKQRADEALTYAQKQEVGARTAQIQMETKDKATLYAAWNNPSSAISRTSRENIRYLLPPGVVSSIPNFDQMTAHELGAMFPNLMQTNAELMKWHQEYSMKVASDTMVDGDWKVRTETVPGPTPGLPGKAVANPIGMANRDTFRKQNQSARVALDNADQLFRSVSGPEDAVAIGLQTPKGQEIYKSLLAFARTAAELSPSGKLLYEELTNMNPQGTFVPSQFIFGAKGKKGSVQQALQEMNANHVSASGPFENEKVQVLGQVPDVPPTYLPMKIVDEPTTQGRKIKTYHFTIGPKSYKYYRNNAGQWKHEEIP